jgi:hypothetical protein
MVCAWSRVGGGPAGFADGVDNETAYAASMPLTASSTTFGLPVTASSPPAADAAAETGRTKYQASSDTLFVCDGTTWRAH